MLKPDPDYVAELEYHHEMYPNELEKPVSLKEKLVAAVEKGRGILGGLSDARDELYGLNGKQGLGLHLKPVDEMEFLPGGMGGAGPSDDAFGMGLPKSHTKKEPKESTVIIKEIHHHHHGGKRNVVVKKKEKRENDGVDMLDPGYIPDSLKKLF